MQDQVIICDLDNTIFDTSSIDPELFASLLHKATEYLSGRFTAEIILSIIQDIVSNPFDRVCEKYGLPKSMILPVLDELNGISLEHSAMVPYEDYAAFRAIPAYKIVGNSRIQKITRGKIEKTAETIFYKEQGRACHFAGDDVSFRLGRPSVCFRSS